MLCIVLLIYIHVCAPADPSEEVYVSDSYGNVIFKDGTIQYVYPIPVGNANYSTNAKYDTKGLDTLHAFSRSFIKDVMPRSFPFDLLDEIVNGNFSVSKDYRKIVREVEGLAACIVIGLLFIVAFIIGGCSFCCCRFCCGKCGGDRIQVYKDNERCMRMGLSQALVLMLICVFSAAVCVYITNDTFTDALHFTNDSLVSNIGDIGRFLNNTGYRFQYVVTNMYDLVHSALQKDFINLGDIAEADIFAVLKVNDLVDDISALDDDLSMLSAKLHQTMSDAIELQRAASRLQAELGSLAEDIETVTTSSCPLSCSPNLCATLDTSAMRNAALNASSLPDLNATATNLEAVRSSNNFTQLAISTMDNLAGISDTIDQASSDIKRTVNSSLMSYYELIHSLSEGVFHTMTEAFPTEEVIEESTDIVETVLDYDKYRRYFGLALTSVFILLVMLYTGGLVLGIFFYDDTALPTERRSLSNLGGNILLFGVGLTFLLGALFMVLTMLAFLFGSLLEKGCEPVENLGYFKEFLDKGKAPGYSLSDITLGVDDFELDTYDVLVGCRADLTPWTVLKMNRLVPLEDYLVYLNYLGSLGHELAKLQRVDVSSFQIVTSDLSKSLAEIQTIGPDDVDFASINNVLREPAVQIDTSATLGEMRAIRDACTNPAQAQWSNFISRLESVEDNEIAAVQEYQNKLQTSSASLESSLFTFSESTKTVVANAARIDFQLENNMTSVLLQSSIGLAGRMFSYLDSYASEVVYVIYNSLGNCRPLWNLYKSVSIVVCDYGVDTLNGYWFSIGWGLFFFTPIVIVAALLANHYKTMDAAVGYQDFDDMDEENGYPGETSLSGSHPAPSVPI